MRSRRSFNRNVLSSSPSPPGEEDAVALFPAGGVVPQHVSRSLRSVAMILTSAAVSAGHVPSLTGLIGALDGAAEQVAKDTAGEVPQQQQQLEDFETPFDNVDTSQMSAYDLGVFQTEKLNWMKENPELARLLRIREAREQMALEEQERLAQEKEPPPTAEELHQQNLQFLRDGVREGIPKEAIAALLKDKDGGAGDMLKFAERLRKDNANDTGDAPDRALADDPPFLQQIREQRVRAFVSHVKHGNYDVNCRDVKGQTALHYCCMLRGEGAAGELNRQAVKALLMQPKVDVNKINGTKDAPLHLAMKGTGSLSVIEELVQANGLEVDVEDGRGRTPLRVAVDADFPAGFNMLIGRNPDPNKVAKDGLSPFLAAVSNSRYSMLRPLIAAGADLRSTDSRKNNCFHLALRKDLLVIPFLLDGLKRWRAGTTDSLKGLKAVAADQAVEEDVPLEMPRSPSVVGADDPLNAVDDSGNTPLHIACASAGVANIARMLRAGADPDIRNNAGLTAAEVAEQHQRGAVWARAMKMART